MFYKSYNKGLAILFLAVLVTSCVQNKIGFSQLSELNKGMTIEEVKGIFQDSPKQEISVSSFETTESIVVIVYNLMSGDYSSDFLFAFKGSKLLFWGYAHEFARSNDKLINDIGKKAISQLKK